MYRYTCKDTTGKWIGKLSISERPGIIEGLANARGSSFHILIGKSCQGTFLCIPNWNIGMAIPSVMDSFWLQEHMRRLYPRISLVDVKSILGAMAIMMEKL